MSFHDIALSKNLVHAGILVVETTVTWFTVAFFYGRPAFDITIATCAGLLFAAPLNFAAGNLLSMYAPRKLDYSKFGGQRAAQMTVLAGIVLQIVAVGIGFGVFWTTRYFGNSRIAALLLLVLAGVSFALYGATLKRIDHIAIERRDTLVAELCRA